MPIDAISVTRYPRVGGPYTTSVIEKPTWETVERELRTMDSWGKPSLLLQQDRDVGSSNCLAVCGGSGVYHIQFADDKGHWRQAVDPDGSDEVIEVWHSDQGFFTKAKFTWPVEKALELVRWYFERGTQHSDFSWVI